MIKKFSRILFLLVLIFAGTVITVADHLFIGIVIFVAMILMVATGPRPGETEEISDLARARKNSEEAARLSGENGDR